MWRYIQIDILPKKKCKRDRNGYEINFKTFWLISMVIQYLIFGLHLNRNAWEC
jgi:hypothetical protein